VFVFGQSSGAVLALHAASRLSQITRLAVYEAPLIVDDTRSPTGPEYHQQLTELLAQGKRGPAVRLFLELVGLPPVMIAAIRLTPIWPKLKTLAKTLPYDSQITAEHQQGRALSREQWATARQPALVLSGGKSDAWMLNGMQALAESLPQATYRVLEGQTHNLRPKTVAPELVRFARDTSGPQRREPQGLG
jgi:pimeloyl-ACP methyl ester carboxylesterase